jgi:dTDP-4-dehydrorhamnose 3,5-epimerase
MNIYRDSRGLFFESCREPDHKFVQDNVSISKKGVVRGLHYQKSPMEQGKFLRVLQGAICDVIVNLKTGEIERNVLSDDKFDALYVPPGFAHGFQALEDNTIVYYKCTNTYSPEHEAGINPGMIEWPLPISEISERDKLWPNLK